MTNTITKITYGGDDYKVGEGYTAGTGISISASNEISNSGVTSVNGSTGAVTVLESQTKVFPMPEVGDDISDIVSWLTAGKGVVLIRQPDGVTNEYYRVYLRYTDTRDILCEKLTIEDGTVTGIWITYSNANIVETADILTRLIAPSGGTAGQVLTQKSNGYPSWQTPSGGDVVVSSQTGNILQSGMSIWAGTETDYGNLGTYDSNTLYLTIE